MHIVYADADGKLYDSERLQAAGRTAGDITELTGEEWIALPEGATIVSLPGTRALGVHPVTGKLTALPENYTAVGALLPQGFTRLYLPAYFRPSASEPLPLFGYSAVGFENGQFYVAAYQSDDPVPWDPLQYQNLDVAAKVGDLQQRFPQNRLYQHLETCALYYECVTSRNTFFARGEGAIPVSPTCNAGCVGCISEQEADSGFPSPQTRLTIRPTVDEMVELMVEHLASAGPNAIISFGQGCEGEPSMRGREIADAIRRTRQIIQVGYININTNAGNTRNIKQIVDSGLDLMRISTISALADHYDVYYRPRGYSVSDVEESARYAAQHEVIVSLNYLVFPGITDTVEEMDAITQFILRTGVKLIQLRNLNIDPDYYLARVPRRSKPVGMLEFMNQIKTRCPDVRLGSYTHPGTWYGVGRPAPTTR